MATEKRLRFGRRPAAQNRSAKLVATKHTLSVDSERLFVEGTVYFAPLAHHHQNRNRGQYWNFLIGLASQKTFSW